MTDNELLGWYIGKTVRDAQERYPDDRAARGRYVTVSMEYLAGDLLRNPDFALEHLRWLHAEEQEAVA